MDVRYFYIEDQVNRGTIHIEHCGTDDMVANFFTRPLQEILFKRQRDLIMNFDPTSVHHSDHRSVLGNEVTRGRKVGITAPEQQVVPGVQQSQVTSKMVSADRTCRDALVSGMRVAPMQIVAK